LNDNEIAEISVERKLRQIRLNGGKELGKIGIELFETERERGINQRNVSFYGELKYEQIQQKDDCHDEQTEKN